MAQAMNRTERTRAAQRRSRPSLNASLAVDSGLQIPNWLLGTAAFIGGAWVAEHYGTRHMVAALLRWVF